jgi:protein-histidine N-methyltransferase
MTGVKARLPALTLVLASETIYAPASLRAFASTVLGLLTRCGADGGVRAFVAAKMVYFGVGGGVEEFLGAVGALGGWGRVAWKSADGGGVGRCVLEVGVR